MSASGYRLTESADADIRDLLRESARRFGPVQRRNYALLIDRAATLVAEMPERPGSRPREDLADGVRSFHVELAAQRRGAASHILYYLRQFPGAGTGVIIVRVLHERMEPALHVLPGLLTRGQG